MSELQIALAIISTTASIITVGIVTLTYVLNVKKEKPHFDITSLALGNHPDRKIRAIQIQNPTKPIDRLQIFCDGTALKTQVGIYEHDWVYVNIGGSVCFGIPDSLSKDEAQIVVKDGKNKLYKAKLKEIPYPI